VYKYVPASKDQTQSHLHSHQVNAKSTGNSTRVLPVSRAGSQHVRKEGVRVSNMLPHTTGAANLPHQLCRKPAHKTSAKKTYEHPTCSPTQRALQVYITGWSQAALFRANSCRRVPVWQQQGTVVVVRECREHSTTHSFIDFFFMICLHSGTKFHVPKFKWFISYYYHTWYIWMFSSILKHWWLSSGTFFLTIVLQIIWCLFLWKNYKIFKHS
jgi:hypothetical protein